MKKPTELELNVSAKPKSEDSGAEREVSPREEEAPLLSVIVAVYNEVHTLQELLGRVLAAPYRKEVIVVDDGSTDGTPEVLVAWEGHPAVRLLRHSRNQGKGAAIWTALEHAQGQFTVIQDADLECDPEDYPRLIEPLLSGEADVVFGSRYLRREDRRQHRWSMLRWGVSLLNVAVRILYGVRLTDEASCYKAIPTSVLLNLELECRRFEFCPEVVAKVCRMGLSIREVPIRYHPRSVRAGKKLRWRDGIQALATLWKWRKWQPKPMPKSDSCRLRREASGPSPR